MNIVKLFVSKCKDRGCKPESLTEDPLIRANRTPTPDFPLLFSSQCRPLDATLSSFDERNGKGSYCGLPGSLMSSSASVPSDTRSDTRIENLNASNFVLFWQNCNCSNDFPITSTWRNPQQRLQELIYGDFNSLLPLRGLKVKLKEWHPIGWYFLNAVAAPFLGRQMNRNPFDFMRP